MERCPYEELSMPRGSLLSNFLFNLERVLFAHRLIHCAYRVSGSRNPIAVKLLVPRRQLAFDYRCNDHLYNCG